MGVRFPTASNILGNPVLPANATETVCFTTSPLTLPYDGAVVLFLASITLTVGTGTTALNLKIRLGTTNAGLDQSGGGWNYTVVAGNLFATTVFSGDIVGRAQMPQYSLTIIQTGATAAGVVSFGAMFTFVL